MADVARWSTKDSDMGMAFKVSSPVRLDQLDDEIAAVHGWANSGLVAEGDLASANVSEPVLIFVTHPNTDPKKVVAAGKSHAPDPDYRRTAPLAEISLLDVATKAAANDWLSPEEIQVAIRGLLARQENL